VSDGSDPEIGVLPTACHFSALETLEKSPHFRVDAIAVFQQNRSLAILKRVKAKT
jgi:hypothetical protein